MSTDQFTQGYTALAMIILQNYALGFELLTSHNNPQNPQGREPTQPPQEKFDKLVPIPIVENGIPHIETEESQLQDRLKLEIPLKKRKRLSSDGDAVSEKVQATADGVSQKRASRRTKKRHRHGTPSVEAVDRLDGLEADFLDSRTASITNKS